MTGDNVRIRSRGTRVCRACEVAASKRVPTPMTETEKERFKAVLTSGQPVTLQFLIHGKPVGGGLKRVKPLVMVKDFYHACRTDPDFARFVKENRPNTLSIGQRARRAREFSIANRAKADQDAKDYFSIQAMIPRWFPEQDKFDVVNDVMAELAAGVITRDELQGRVRFYMKQAGKMFAPKHSKFGDCPLVSLDEVLFEDGSMTRGDTVSRGLWD